ncbi:DUF3147 family protein [Acidobacteria bacterium AB60]|nr:DUF3147 family protein [Acidobacteria bacterium AB60]
MVQAKLASIKGIRPHEWAVRFLFGGATCVLAGLIANRWGPAVGGLFLAFPAIFPAGASLVEAHERMHKARAGLDGTQRGRVVAGVDAAGATLGCIGLAAFALVCWFCLPHLNVAVAFAIASAAWLTIALAAWLLRKSRLFRSRKRIPQARSAPFSHSS